MNFKIYFLAALLLVGFSACEESLEDLNVDPNNPTVVSLPLMLPEAEIQSVFNAGLEPARGAGLIMQQFYGLDAQQIEFYNYVLGEGFVNTFWSSAMYSGVLRSCKVIIDQATEEERPFYVGVGKIILADQLGILTSYLGDLPYSEAFQGRDNLQPAYDSQESIYANVQTLLDEGIAAVTGGGYAGGDVFFDGDADKWVATAKVLKARYIMHLQRRDGGAAAAALAQLQDGFTSSADQPNLTFGTSLTANWALAKFGVDRPSTLGIDPSFAAMMENDPRKDKYMYTDGTTWFYFGDEELYWAQNDATVPYVSFVEAKFLEAEAIVRTGGADADASAALAAAITANINFVGATDTENYVATKSDLTGLDEAAKIERIMTEAYKAYYGYNFHETWVNQRRTGYPVLNPPTTANSNFFSNGVAAIPARFLYPQDESASNRANVEAAKQRQGGALLDAKLWAFE